MLPNGALASAVRRSCIQVLAEKRVSYGLLARGEPSGGLCLRRLHRQRRVLALLRRRRGEAVADAEVRVDVGPLRRGTFELVADLADEHVHGTVAADHRVAPQA